jgi:hypothetical protein
MCQGLFAAQGVKSRISGVFSIVDCGMRVLTLCKTQIVHRKAMLK